jgi:hypothetical protein
LFRLHGLGDDGCFGNGFALEDALEETKHKEGG